MVVYRSNVLSFMTNQLTVLSCILFVSLTGTRRYYVSCSLFQKQHRQKRSTIRIRKHICWTSMFGLFWGCHARVRSLDRLFVTHEPISPLWRHDSDRVPFVSGGSRKSQLATHENDRLCHHGNKQVNKYTAQQALEQLYSYITFTS